MEVAEEQEEVPRGSMYLFLIQTPIISVVYIVLPQVVHREHRYDTVHELVRMLFIFDGICIQPGYDELLDTQINHILLSKGKANTMNILFQRWKTLLSNCYY